MFPYEIERDYGESRVNELLKENNLYGATLICVNYPVTKEALIRTLKACSRALLIEIVDYKRNNLDIKTLSRNTMMGLLKIVLTHKGVGKKYKAIIQRKIPKTI
ncbi:MAG: hypothetical protein WA091_02970 [Minisyncoccales bacterium]